MAAILFFSWRSTSTFWLLVLLLMMMAATSPTSADTSKRCGELFCDKYYYCARQQKHCLKCDTICEKTNHNYNEPDCQEFCQDYIHDFVEEYVRKVELRDLENTLRKLYEIVLVSFVLLLSLTAIAIAAGGRHLYQWRKSVRDKNLEKKKYQQKLTSVQYSISNSADNNNSRNTNEMVRTISQGPSTMTLTTQTTTDSPQNTNRSSCSGTAKTLPLSTREPCEDTTLDYAAYVNEALSSSPLGNKVV